jgi:hypothetical protein
MKDKIFVFTSSFSSVKPFYFKILHIVSQLIGLEAFKLLNDEKHRNQEMMYLLRSKNIKMKMKTISNIPKQIIFCGSSTNSL